MFRVQPIRTLLRVVLFKTKTSNNPFTQFKKAVSHFYKQQQHYVTVKERMLEDGKKTERKKRRRERQKELRQKEGMNTKKTQREKTKRERKWKTEHAERGKKCYYYATNTMPKSL